MAEVERSDVEEVQPIIHAGRLLRDHIQRKGLNQAEIARRSFMTPQTLSGILNRASIQLETLVRLSVVMEHDFFKDISALLAASKVADPPEEYIIQRPDRQPVRFTIEVHRDDVETITRLAELLRGLKTP